MQQHYTRLAHLQSGDMNETPLRTLSFDCCALCQVVERDGEHMDEHMDNEFVSSS